MQKPAFSKLLLTALLLILSLFICLAGVALFAPLRAKNIAVSESSLSQPNQETEETMNMTLSSPAFGAGQPIPVTYSCRGRDISPALEWGDPPASTQSFALIMDDPDAPVGTWDHWVLYNIPASVRRLPEAIPAEASLPDGSLHGKNSWGRLGYGGPCPPSGTHRYFFRLYALDTTLPLSSGASKKQVLEAMKGHILAQAELMGTFSK
ncbi:MAG: YbhB/YbcL family Raf kinase inhibitor-like protein [Anaerolineae bacterium]